MPDLNTPDDVSHWWGGDLELSPSGDLARASLDTRSRQRVLRRLLTGEGEYLMHVGYGAGLPEEIGAVLDLAKVTAKIRGQMFLEESVIQTPQPSIAVNEIPNGVAASINYLVAPERTPAVLSFSVAE